MKHSDHTSGDTIVAVSTPRGYSGIGVVRLSGPEAVSILQRIFRTSNSSTEFPNRTAVYGRVVNPETQQVLDDGMVLVMKGPSSYTGEDVAELSLHGSPIILDMVVRMIAGYGARLAERGEFTRRAFLSGKLDLVQAEAVIDLIEAKSPMAIDEARARLDKSLSCQIWGISDALKDILAEVEAHIDFDEDEEEAAPDVEPRLREVFLKMSVLKRNTEAGRIRREGLNVVIVGKPNVGKSTLFNALLKADRMIVTPYPGTTRDPVDDYLTLRGIAILLCDTAGIRERADPVEEQGIGRTYDRIERADLVLAVLDGTTALEHEDFKVLEACQGKKTIIVLNKQDLGLAISPEDQSLGPEYWPRVSISAKTGFGVNRLEDLLGVLASEIAESISGGSLSSRCVLLMDAAEAPVKDLLTALDRGEEIRPEIVSLELRRALSPLKEITGETADEGVLDRIFERFCVGK